MEANLWFTKASIVVDTRLVFPEREKKKKAEKRKREKGVGMINCRAQGVFACICTNSV